MSNGRRLRRRGAPHHRNPPDQQVQAVWPFGDQPSPFTFDGRMAALRGWTDALRSRRRRRRERGVQG